MEILKVNTTEEKFLNIPGDIQIKGTTGLRTYKKVSDRVDEIGELTRVVHYRNVKRGLYVTYVLGTRGAIRVKGGLKSGGNGEGEEGLCKVVELLGFDREMVWKEIIKEELKVSRLEFVV